MPTLRRYSPQSEQMHSRTIDLTASRNLSESNGLSRRGGWLVDSHMPSVTLPITPSLKESVMDEQPIA
jgi:hypothetical protein